MRTKCVTNCIKSPFNYFLCFDKETIDDLIQNNVEALGLQIIMMMILICEALFSDPRCKHFVINNNNNDKNNPEHRTQTTIKAIYRCRQIQRTQ
jgi:hypothetical protein